MQIIFKKTSEWLPEEWETYTQSFEEVFHKAFSADDFRHKYLNTIDGYSYHSLLKEEGSVVGGCSIIPYEYQFSGKIIRVGLAVDVFIWETCRSDFYTLFRMYRLLRNELMGSHIPIVIAVPNEISYLYWKKIVNWKDVGFLRYYALPVRAGTIISRIPGLLNRLSILGTAILLTCSRVVRSAEKKPLISIDRTNSVTEKQRYRSWHTVSEAGNAFFSYRVVNEDGIKTCYLIDFYNKQGKMKDALSLNKAVRHILSNEKIDLLLFVGRLKFFQALLFRVPFRSEPRHLYFMADILDPGSFSDPELIYDFNNWDFGLFNFDVR